MDESSAVKQLGEGNSSTREASPVVLDPLVGRHQGKEGKEKEDTLGRGNEELPAEEEESSQSPGPKSRVSLAHEFRMDAVLDPEVIPMHFYCCVCGTPAGKNMFSCKVYGHPVCRDCKHDLKIEGCPCVLKEKDGDEPLVCSSVLQEIRSILRDVVFDNTKVTCMYGSDGCQVEGIWEAVEKHQKVCEYANK